MKYLLKDEIKEAEDAREIYIAATVFDDHSSKVVKSNIKNFLSSTKGLLTSFSAGLTKGMVSGGKSSSSTAYTGLLQLLLKM
mgnify:FL=1